MRLLMDLFPVLFDEMHLWMLRGIFQDAFLITHAFFATEHEWRFF